MQGNVTCVHVYQSLGIHSGAHLLPRLQTIPQGSFHFSRGLQK